MTVTFSQAEEEGDAGSPGVLSHGMGKTLEEAVWPEIADDEVERVLQAFPQIGKLEAILWRSPRPFSAAARIRTRKGCFFVKRHHARLRSPTDLREEHRLNSYLRSKGGAVVPVLATREGETVFSDRCWNYEIHGLGEGIDVYQDRQSWTPFLHVDHASAAGKALAQMHHLLLDYDAPARSTRLLIANDRLLRSSAPLSALEEDLAARPALAAFLGTKPWRNDLWEHVLQPYHTQARAALIAAPPLWSHGDWHGSNLLWSSEHERGTVSTILDFGLSDRTSALFDLGTAIERSLIPWLDLEGGEPVCNLDQLEVFLRGYSSIAPLSSSFLHALAAVLPGIHMDFALSEIEYFSGLLDHRDYATLAYETYLLSHADWFSRAEGQRLLRYLHHLARQAE
ncbi:MAG: phosphotransferase [Acetobacter sp.]|jgi:Ser/Thr protein kinase RdoA (MazF antagonist)